MPNNFPKIALFLSVLFFIVSCILFSFLHTKVKDNNIISEQDNTVWQNEANRRNILSSMDHSLKAMAGEIMQVNTHFAQSSDVVPFLDYIEKTASIVGLNAEIVSVDVPEKEKVLVVVVNTEGVFEEVYKFLTLLENAPYQLEFVSVHMTRESGKVIPLPKVAHPSWNGYFKINLLSFIK